MVNKKPDEIYKEYTDGKSYNTSLGLYDTVRRNNDFYNGRQWGDLDAPDIDKPVFNYLKQVVNYFIAMLISDDVATSAEMEAGAADMLYVEREMDNAAIINTAAQFPALTKMKTGDVLSKILAAEVENIMERTDARMKNRRMIRNTAVDGDGCFYMWFDEDADTGYDYRGAIKIDLIDNTNVLFGAPAEYRTQEQPYILIIYKKLTEAVKDEAEKNGLQSDAIRADGSVDDYSKPGDQWDDANKYTTVIVKLWKEKSKEAEGRKTVHVKKVTQDAVVMEEKDTGLELYPVVYMSWEHAKNCYHGVSPMTANIANQIYVNKMMALLMRAVSNTALPKTIYNEQFLPDGYDPDPAMAIGVNGDPKEMIYEIRPGMDISGSAMNIVNMVIENTKTMMGASDAALGNVRPDNTSAIIAVQKAASAPLDMQRMEFHNFVEGYVRVFVDMMRVYYGTREISFDTDGEKVTVPFDFGMLEDYMFKLRVDIGQGSYWSEITQVQTLDALMANNILTRPDALIYLEGVPEGYIKNKNKMMEFVKQRMQQAATQTLTQQGMGGEIDAGLM